MTSNKFFIKIFGIFYTIEMRNNITILVGEHPIL